MKYERVNWKDYPDVSTKLNAENLNVMDKGVSDAAEAVNTLNNELTELKKSVSDGKSSIASAITSAGAATDADATYATMAKNIENAANSQYTTGHADGKKEAMVGTATKSQVLTGKTFTNSTGVGLTGAMTNNGAVSKVITPGIADVKYTILAGYHNGSGTVTCSAVYASKTLESTDVGTVDMGGAYRYVNTNSVYSAGYAAGGGGNVRYNSSTGYVQVLDTNGNWVNVYQCGKPPIQAAITWNCESTHGPNWRVNDTYLGWQGGVTYPLSINNCTKMKCTAVSFSSSSGDGKMYETDASYTYKDITYTGDRVMCRAFNNIGTEYSIDGSALAGKNVSPFYWQWYSTNGNAGGDAHYFTATLVFW